MKGVVGAGIRWRSGTVEPPIDSSRDEAEILGVRCDLFVIVALVKSEGVNSNTTPPLQRGREEAEMPIKEKGGSEKKRGREILGSRWVYICRIARDCWGNHPAAPFFHSKGKKTLDRVYEKLHQLSFIYYLLWRHRCCDMLVASKTGSVIDRVDTAAYIHLPSASLSLYRYA